MTPDALSTATEAVWLQEFEKELEPYLYVDVRRIVSDYARDVRRLYVGKLIRMRRFRNIAGPKLSVRSDVTSYACGFVCNYNPGTELRVCAVSLHTPPGQLRCIIRRAEQSYNALQRSVHHGTTPMPTADELWDFYCGGYSSAFAIAVAAIRTAPNGIIDVIRASLQRKITHWCAIHECAAVARVRFGRSR